jgi:hypothetical protein
VSLNLDPADDELVICEFCGMEIEADDQRCPALEEGRCRP